jgi:cytochrome P450
VTAPTESAGADTVELSSRAFWARPDHEREEAFRVLRDERPVSWHPPVDGLLMAHDDPGYWAVVCHEDVVTVSRHPEVFCSGRGVIYEDVPAALLEASQSFLAMDDPRHARLRRLISAAFTPRQVARIERQIRREAKAVVDDMQALSEGDFVTEVSRRIPMATFSEMVGVPPEQREAVIHAADTLVGWNDPETLAGRSPLELLTESLVTLHTTARAMAENRRRRPADDLMTALVRAEAEGEQLTDDEIAAFFVLLAVAGNDTTRHTISHAMKALCDAPDQRRLLATHFDAHIRTAVEEFVRWATPVMTFRRTATRDVELHGQRIAEGDKVVMFYSSANRDERAIPNPHRFDITREPNHVGFGGGGPHFCLGASLARSQLRAIFGEILHRLPNLEVGEPEPLVGNFIHGIKKMPFRQHS